MSLLTLVSCQSVHLTCGALLGTLIELVDSPKCMPPTDTWPCLLDFIQIVHKKGGKTEKENHVQTSDQVI